MRNLGRDHRAEVPVTNHKPFFLQITNHITNLGHFTDQAGPSIHESRLDLGCFTCRGPIFAQITHHAKTPLKPACTQANRFVHCLFGRPVITTIFGLKCDEKLEFQFSSNFPDMGKIMFVCLFVCFGEIEMSFLVR